MSPYVERKSLIAYAPCTTLCEDESYMAHAVLCGECILTDTPQAVLCGEFFFFLFLFLIDTPQAVLWGVVFLIDTPQAVLCREFFFLLTRH